MYSLSTWVTFICISMHMGYLKWKEYMYTVYIYLFIYLCFVCWLECSFCLCVYNAYALARFCPRHSVVVCV